ncbi:MAG: LysM peptidoglycan-binding domain-containing protein [Oligoflexus sp.]
MKYCRKTIFILLLSSQILKAQDNMVDVGDLNAIEDDMDFDFASDFENDGFAEPDNNFLPADQFDQPADVMFEDPMQGNEDILFENENSTIPMNQMMTGDSDAGFRTMENDVAPLVQKIESPNLFAGAPPIPGTLRTMASGEAPEEYRVRMGDTLFDICDQLIDEPGYWPKLWALNPYIRNPHFIYPGMTLRFYPGDKDNPPFLQVVMEDDLIPIDRGQLTEDELLQQDISGLLTRSELPDRTPVIGADEITSFPEVDEAFLTYGSLFEPKDIKVLIPAFFFTEEVESLGEVLGGTSGSILIDRDQDIVIRSEGSLSLNTGYTIVRYSGEVEHPKTGDFIGYRYEFIAQINVQKQIEDELMAARVLLNRLGVQPGDIVIPYQTVQRKIPLQAEGKNGNGQVVIGFEQPFSYLAGRGSFVYLETKTQAIQVGDTLNIFQNVQRTATIFTASKLPEFRQRIAKAYIIENYGPAVVGYILEDQREVRIGDDTGS